MWERSKTELTQNLILQFQAVDSFEPPTGLYGVITQTQPITAV
jgi:hypothetical protein